MNRAKLGMFVDVLSLVVLLAVVSSGLVLKLMLPAGSGRLPIEGGPHADVLLLWGLSRHQWGTVHSGVSITLLLVLALHICLHWRFIRGVFSKGDDPARRRKIVLGITSLGALMVLAIAPFFSPVQVFKVRSSVGATSAESPGGILYSLKCQRCHTDQGVGIPVLPYGHEGENYLKKLEPRGPHAELRKMTDEELKALVEYLNGPKLNGRLTKLRPVSVLHQI